MKKRNLILGIVAVSVLAASAMADPTFNGGEIRFYDGNDYITVNAIAQTRLARISGSSNGGAFEVDVRNGSLPVWGSGQNIFTTYCVEQGITYNPGRWYWTSVDDVALSGGAGNGLNGDPVSDVTEWIYDQWLDNAGLGFSQDAISQAIWHAEGDKQWNQISNEAKAVYSAALLGTGHVLGTTPDQLGLATHTRAMNLWSNLSYNASGDYWVACDTQSQLIRVPTPQASLLGLIGMTALTLLRRRA